MSIINKTEGKAYYHLPGLFEFYEFYKEFLPLYREHPEYFYDWCDIGSIYGAPADCVWGGGRVGYGEDDPEEVAALMREYGISARLTFSNSLLQKEHLKDKKCNDLCRIFAAVSDEQDDDANKKDRSNESNRSINRKVAPNGIIVYSDLLLNYIEQNYPGFYFVSSTTKVITDFDKLREELNRPEFAYVVPDFRLNKQLEKLNSLTAGEKNKVEFLCNECCDFGCSERAACYENVSRKSLGEDCKDHICPSADSRSGYLFSKAKKNPGFIGVRDIREIYVPMGFSNFKIEGRSLGSAILLEFILHYLTKPACQLEVREAIYLDSMLDLF